MYLVCCEKVLGKKMFGCLKSEVSTLGGPGMKVAAFLWYPVVWFNPGISRLHPWRLGSITFVRNGCRD